jgi:hypothetical protein
MNIAAEWYPLLQRYARLIIRNNEEASLIASKCLLVLEKFRDDVIKDEQLRDYFMKCTRGACMCWLRDQALLLKKSYSHKK